MSDEYKDYKIALDTNIFIDMFGTSGYKKLFDKIEELKKQNRFFVTETVKKELETHINNQKTFDERINRVLPKFSEQTNNDKVNLQNLKYIEKDFLKYINKKDDIYIKKLKKFIEDKSKNLEKELTKNKEEIIKNINNVIVDFDYKSSLSYEEKIFTKNEYDFRVCEGLSTPGSKDKEAKEGRTYYNDFFIFKENIKHSQDNNCNVLFVTGDSKENKACRYYDGDISEYFKENTNKEYKVIDFETFNKEFNINIDDEDIEIIEENEIVRLISESLDNRQITEKEFHNKIASDSSFNIIYNGYTIINFAISNGYEEVASIAPDFLVQLKGSNTCYLIELECFKLSSKEVVKKSVISRMSSIIKSGFLNTILNKEHFNCNFCIITQKEFEEWKSSGKSILELIEECVVE